jgi:hypothetical protein
MAKEKKKSNKKKTRILFAPCEKKAMRKQVSNNRKTCVRVLPKSKFV